MPVGGNLALLPASALSQSVSSSGTRRVISRYGRGKYSSGDAGRG
jgi:hypothetical protein